MALSDINFQEGEGMDFISKVPVGTLNAPLDILIESDSAQFCVLETPRVTGSGSNIFIMSE